LSDNYCCPFCLSVSKCIGPHIQPEDLSNFEDYLSYEREAAICQAITVIASFNPQMRRLDALAALHQLLAKP
jgi:hypothetical protein